MDIRFLRRLKRFITETKHFTKGRWKPKPVLTKRGAKLVIKLNKKVKIGRSKIESVKARKNLQKWELNKSVHLPKYNNSIFSKVLIFLTVLYFLSHFIFSQLIGKCYSDPKFDLVPAPQYISYEGFDIDIERNWTIVDSTQDNKLNFSVKWLDGILKKEHSITLKNSNFPAFPASKRIVLGCFDDNDYIRSILDNRNIQRPDNIGSQGYIVRMFQNDPQEIFIMANTPQGIFYGIQSFLKLISKGKIIGVSIIDFPDHDFRAIMDYPGNSFMGKNIPKFTETEKKAIDNLARLKINALFHYNRAHFFKNNSDYVYQYKKIMEYCKERFIDYIPNIGSLRRIANLPFKMIEGWWVKDELFTVAGKDNILEANVPFLNLLSNGDFSSDIDQDGIPDGWKISDSATVLLNNNKKLQSELKIFKGIISREFITEKNKHYCIVAKGKGFSPVVNIRAVSKKGDTLYKQFDSKRKFHDNWEELGVTIKTNEETEKIIIEFFGKNGAISISDVRLYRLDGSLKNVIRSENTDIRITDTANTIKYKEGIDYVIKNGETSNRFNPQMKPFIIKRLGTGNIKPKQTVRISYDAVYAWSLTKWHNQPQCVSEPSLYTDYYYPAIDRVIDELRPKFIHFASDEVKGFNRDSRNRKRGLTNAELFSEWVNNISAYVKRKDPQCKVIIWSDMISPFHNGGNEFFQLQYGGSPGRMAEAVEQNMITNDVVINNWWYFSKWFSQMVNSTEFFSSKGYTLIGSPWYENKTVENWSQLLYGKKNTMGGMVTNWVYSDWPAQNHYINFADHFWNTHYQNIFFSGFEKNDDQGKAPDKWSLIGASEEQNEKNNQLLRSQAYIVGEKEAQGNQLPGVAANAILLQGGDPFFESEFIKIDPNEEYELGIYIKRKFAKGSERPEFSIIWFDSFQRRVSISKKSIDNVKPTYSLFQIKSVSPNLAEYAKIQFRAQVGGSEKFIFDSVLLKKKLRFDNNVSIQSGAQ